MTRQRAATMTIGAALLLLAGQASAAASPAHVRIRSIAYAGSGCPAGTVAEIVANDKQAFTLLFDSYIAEAGPGVLFAAKRKNCQVSLNLDFPQGWSFSLATIDYRGFAALQRGVTGLQRAAYYFTGDALTKVSKSTLVGPLESNYHYRDELGLESLVWSSCSATRALNINTEVRVDNSRAPSRNGLLTVDSIDGNFELIFGLRWRRC